MTVKPGVEDSVRAIRGGSNTHYNAGLGFDAGGFKRSHDSAEGKWYAVEEMMIPIVGALEYDMG